MGVLSKDEYDKQWEIPFHMTQHKEIEQYLEEKALEGYMIEGFTPLFRYGYFSYLTSGVYHFYIDAYPVNITEKLLKSSGFNDYLDQFREKGWTPKTYYKNLVIFYSDAPERPEELQTDYAFTRKQIYDITIKNLNRQMALLTLVNFAFIWLELYFFYLPDTKVRIAYYVQLTVFFIVFEALYFTRVYHYFATKKALKEGTAVPKGYLPSSNMALHTAMLLTFFISMIAYFFTNGSVIFTIVTTLLLISLMSVFLIMYKRKLLPNYKLPFYKGTGGIAIAIVLLYMTAFYFILWLFER